MPWRDLLSFMAMNRGLRAGVRHENPRRERVLGKAEQAEVVLRAMIGSGRWKARLPGSRALASLLGVSGGTLGKVLKRLEVAGVIVGAGPRIRYRILDSPGGKTSLAQGEMTLLVIIPKTLGKQTIGQHWQLVARLSDLLVSKDWRVRLHTVKVGGGVIRSRQWDRLLAMENPDAVLAILGDSVLAKWALRRDLRILFCGGSSDEIEVPVIGISTAAMLDYALRELMKLGHTRIVFPLCNRSLSFTRSIRAKFQEFYRARGIPFREGLQTPVAAVSQPRELRQLFRRVEGGLQPTAWICLDWVEFLWVKRQIESRGLRIPSDVSLICLSSDEAVDWVEPLPSHFEHPLERLARELAKWVSGSMHNDRASGSKQLLGRWVPGQTIGPAKS